MSYILSVVAILLNVVLISLAIKKVEVSTGIGITVAIAELTLTILSIALLGLWGIPVALAILATGVLILSVRSAIEFESLCASCSINGRFSSKEEASRFIRSLLRSHDAFMYMGHKRLGELVLRLSERNRSPDEITDMALPIAMLHAAFKHDPIALADRIDQILRTQRRPARDARAVADVITASVRSSPATFGEMLESLDDTLHSSTQTGGGVSD